MRPLDENTIFQFVEHYAYKSKGFKLNEITPYFEKYQPGMPSPRQNDMQVKKGDHFRACIQLLNPKNQRYSLYDLCDSPPNIRNIPSESERLRLLGLIVQNDGCSTLGLQLSKIAISGVMDDWYTAASRIQSNPAGAVTSARTLLETTFKTILSELDIEPDGSGDINKLYKQIREALGINPNTNATQPIHQVCQGTASIVNGLASISNSAGDRHGLTGGEELSDTTIASFAVNAAGSLALFICKYHKEKQRMNI